MNNRFVTTIFFHSDGQLSRIVGEGDPTPLGTTFGNCGFSAPSINDKGEIAFGACTNDGQALIRDGIFVHANGQLIPIAVNEDVTDILPGKFYFNFFPAVQAYINNNSEVLFQGKIILDSLERERYGWFLKTHDGIKKIFLDADPLVDGLSVKDRTIGTSDLNDNGEVAFAVLLDGKADSGIFRRSGNQISKIMAQGDATPIGGKFSTLDDPDLIENFLLLRPRINANSAVAFKAKVIDGRSGTAIFLASPNAMLKVVAVGDTVPTGETIREIDTFALNDLGEVAFFAYGRKNHTQPLGVYKATPAQPVIKKVKLKNKNGRLELRVNGNGMITNDSVIEINGVRLEVMSYPETAREAGGTTTQIISRDAQLEQLLPVGQTVQIKVYNALTNRFSEVRNFTRQ
ncbi:MAG: choice-of-anchor tandem repeat NxxGxxAF-containing protein [Acidobacteriota bacterium]